MCEYPGERNPVAAVRLGEGPDDARPGEPLIDVGIVDDEKTVIEVHKVAPDDPGVGDAHKNHEQGGEHGGLAPAGTRGRLLRGFPDLPAGLVFHGGKGPSCGDRPEGTVYHSAV